MAAGYFDNWSEEQKQNLYNDFTGFKPFGNVGQQTANNDTGWTFKKLGDKTGGTNYSNLNSGGVDTPGVNDSIISKFNDLSSLNDPLALANFNAQGKKIRANRNSYSSPYFLGNSSTAARDAEGGFSAEESDFANGWGDNSGVNGGGGGGSDSWFTADNLNSVGAIMGGIGSLGSAWASLKNVGVAKQALAEQVAQWDRNYAAQKATTNNQIANQNAWKTAQGRSDMGTMIG